MTPKLSIIIPCYNCEKTLEEAVASCYVQDLKTNEFEIIMVDDGSSDGTKKIMQSVSRNHKNISLLFHDKNRGGGAARNTGIRSAQNEIIYCLDSDNFFEPKSVRPMIDHIVKNNLDGVAFFERRFFVGTNSKKYSTHKNLIVNKTLSLLDVLSNSEIMIDNFFFTKTGYLKTSGYPEHHGFDSQCYEIRFLAAGNTIGISPSSIFWHRQAGGKKSYFERVYESGEFSLNIYYMMEDIVHLLSNDARALIFEFDIFGKSKLGDTNLLSTLRKALKEKKLFLFRDGYTRYLNPKGFAEYLKNEGAEDELALAIYSYKLNNYLEASRLFQLHLASNKSRVIVYYNLLRSAIGSSGIEKNMIEKTALQTSQSFCLKKQKIDLNPGVIKQFIYSLYSVIK